MAKIVSIGECMLEMQREADGRYLLTHGGDTFNFAQYLAWLSGEEDKVFYLTAIGNDSLSEEMLNSWKYAGLQTDLIMHDKERTSGLYFANTDAEGNRDYIFYRSTAAAKEMFSHPKSQEIFKRALEGDVIYASLISLMILSPSDREKLIAVFEAANNKGITTVFDTNFRASGWISSKEAKEWLEKIAPFTSIALPTNDDCLHIFDEKEPDAIIERFQALGVKEVVVKCGADGCQGSSEGNTFKVKPSAPIEALDTTAAGDSFNAGYLYGKLRGHTPAISAQVGNQIAGEVIQHRGAIIPKEKVLESLTIAKEKIA